MKTLMLVMVLLSSGIAVADDLPAQCAQFTKPPDTATIGGPAIEARISLAMCVATAKLNALKLAPDDASIKAMADAVKPSLDLLDLAIKANDPAWTPVAQGVRASLYLAMAIRMRNSVPTITNLTVGPEFAAHDEAHSAIEAKIKPWLDEAAH